MVIKTKTVRDKYIIHQKVDNFVIIGIDNFVNGQLFLILTETVQLGMAFEENI